MAPPNAGVEVPTQRRALWLLAAITLVGAAARFTGLGAQCLWMDELYTRHFALGAGSRGFAWMAESEVVPPLYYLLVNLVLRAGGDSALGLRLPSAVASVLTIPAFYFLGLRLFRSRLTGLLAASLLAISPLAIWYAQEARTYSLVLLLSTVYVLLAWPALERPLRTWEWVALGSIVTLGLYAHHVMALVPLAFFLLLVSRRGLSHASVRAWLVTHAMALLAFSPWILWTRHLYQPNVAKPLPILWIPYTLFVFLFGFSFGPSAYELRTLAPGPALLRHAALIIPAGLAGCAALFMGARRVLRPETRTAGLWCLLWLAWPPCAMVVVAVLADVTYNVRYAIGAYPATALLLAAACQQARGSWTRVLPLALVVFFMTWSSGSWYADPRYAKEDVRPLAAMLRQDAGEGRLLVAPWNIRPLLRYYGYELDGNAVSLDGLPAHNLTRALEQVKSLAPPGRVWFIEYRQWEVDPRGALRGHLDAHDVLEAAHSWPGVSLRIYRPKDGVGF